MSMSRIIGIGASAAMLLSACAQDPKDIQASYISPIMYENYSCQQLRQEAERVSARAGEVTGTQKQKATGDAVAMGVSLVIFWPALFFIKGDQQTAGEVARLKGEMDAIEQASIAKNCGIEVRQAPAPQQAPGPVPGPRSPAMQQPGAATMDPASPIH